MNKNFDNDDTFLGRWVAGTLTEEERVAFEKTEAYKQFQAINKETQLLEGPTIETKLALENVKKKINHKVNNTKVVRLWYSMAAAVVVFVSLTVVLNSTKTYTTGIGEKLTITLADGSVIDLNANSKLSHKRFFWKSNKVLDFSGEGYFTITKGKDFIVNTSKGKVAVLGTKFNIKDRANFELKCYEGKVRFVSNQEGAKPYILTKGMQVSVDTEQVKKANFKEHIPDWKNGESKFNNQPFSDVIEELKHIYPIDFELNSIDLSRKFTGSFKHDDLNNALKTTMIPMGITYQKVTQSNLIILSD